MYRYVQSFPASNSINDKSIFNIYRAVVNHIFNVIPESLFRTKILDFKDNARNIYTYKNGSLVDRKEAGRIEMPSFSIEFNNQGNNTQETQLALTAPFTQYSIAQGINPEMRGYTPLFQDHHGVQIFSSDVFCRTEFNITMAVQSLDDRTALCNILDNNLRQHYGNELKNILTQWLLPHGMIDYIREALYVKEFNVIRSVRDELDNDEIKRMADNIDKDFIKHMEIMSDGVFSCVKLSPNDDGLNLAYNRHYTRAYYKLNNPVTVNEGERRGELYDKYTITASGVVEYYNPIAFIVNVPSVIKGEWVKNYHVLSYKPDRITGKLKVKSYPPVYIDQREQYKKQIQLDKKKDILCYDEREFLCDNGKDEYPITLKMMEKAYRNQLPSEVAHKFFTEYTDEYCDCKDIKEFIVRYRLDYKLKDSIMDQILIIYPDLDEATFKKLFKIFVWKDNEFLEEGRDYKLTQDLNLELYNTNSQSVYSFELYCDKYLSEFKYLRYLEDNNINQPT